MKIIHEFGGLFRSFKISSGVVLSNRYSKSTCLDVSVPSP
jgi:hypothetical protein